MVHVVNFIVFVDHYNFDPKKINPFNTKDSEKGSQYKEKKKKTTPPYQDKTRKIQIISPDRNNSHFKEQSSNP